MSCTTFALHVASFEGIVAWAGANTEMESGQKQGVWLTKHDGLIPRMETHNSDG